MSIIDEIAAERRRQIEQEGWTAKHDDEHTDESLASAAACYALPDVYRHYVSRYPPDMVVGHYVPALWPESWDGSWWKSNSFLRRRDLIKAAALLVAEIERLDRIPSAEESA